MLDTFDNRQVIGERLDLYYCYKNKCLSFCMLDVKFEISEPISKIRSAS